MKKILCVCVMLFASASFADGLYIQAPGFEFGFNNNRPQYVPVVPYYSIPVYVVPVYGYEQQFNDEYRGSHRREQQPYHQSYKHHGHHHGWHK